MTRKTLKNRRPGFGPSPARHRQAGFTLVELMVVVVIVGILASVGLDLYTGHMREANVNKAVPYLTSIAAKQRIHYNRTGRYLAATSEADIQSRLGVDLTGAGDFCFMTYCVDGTACGAYSGDPAQLSQATVGSLIDVPTGQTAPAFQVIAVLRNTNSGSSVTGAGQTCTVVNQTGTSTPKLASGWVRDSGKGSAGRVAVMTYPPVNGSNSTTVGSHSVLMDWRDGIALSDALAE